jgi:hypothetical protein
MTIDSQENKAFRAVVERLEVVNVERVAEKLHAGKQVTGYWGKALLSRYTRCFEGSANTFRHCSNWET